MQVLPETLPYRLSPEQPDETWAYSKASQWSHRIFLRRLSLPLSNPCERGRTDWTQWEPHRDAPGY
jgi:hypothetical protein